MKCCFNIGLPGSGKTTLSKLISKDSDWTILSFDQIVYDLKFCPQDGPIVLNKQQQFVVKDTMLEKFLNSKDQNKNVILDAVFNYKIDRYIFLDYLTRPDDIVIYNYFDINEFITTSIKNRPWLDSRFLLGMARHFDIPSENECDRLNVIKSWDEITSLSYE